MGKNYVINSFVCERWSSKTAVSRTEAYFEHHLTVFFSFLQLEPLIVVTGSIPSWTSVGKQQKSTKKTPYKTNLKG